MPQFETAAPFFWSQVFWLIVAFVVLYLLMSKIALPRIAEVLEERQDKIDDDLAKAEKLKNEAEQVLAEYEKAIADARSSAAAALKEASGEMAAEAAKREEAFNAELAGKISEAEGRIAAARNEALQNLTVVATEVTAAATDRLIGTKLDEATVSKAVDDAMGGRG